MRVNELSSGIRNVAEIVKKGDNLELYATLLNLYEKALELQDENKELKDQLIDKSKVESIRGRVIRHPQPFITLRDDESQILYCAHCWDNKEKLIQVNTEPKPAVFTCPSCKNSGIYDQEVHDRYEESRKPRRPNITVI